MIGALKDQVASGFIWSFLFGPLGIVVVLCLPDRKKQKEKEDAERKQQAAVQLQLQQSQLQRLQQIINGGISITKKSVGSTTDIIFNCPRCGQHLAVEQRGAGMSVNCPSCNEQIEIPRSGASQ